MSRSFRHVKCGTVTELPIHVVATILRDPHLVGDTATCAHCGARVPLSECVWIGSGQDLKSYLDELRAEEADEWTESLVWPDETEESPHGRS